MSAIHTCRVCGCTDLKPCDPPCSWETPALCTTCYHAILGLTQWRERARRPNVAALIRAFRSYWTADFIRASRIARGGPR